MVSQKSVLKLLAAFFMVVVLMVSFSPKSKQSSVEIATTQTFSSPETPKPSPAVTPSPTASCTPSQTPNLTPSASLSPKPKVSRITFVNWPALDGGRIDKVAKSYACDIEFRKRHGPQVEVVLIPLENNFLLNSDDLLLKALKTSQLIYVNAEDVLSSSNPSEAKLKKVFDFIKQAGTPIWINIDRISIDNTEWLRQQHIHWISSKTGEAYTTLLSQRGFKEPALDETDHESEYRWNEVEFEDQGTFDTMLDENGNDESLMDKEVHLAADFVFLLPYQPALSRDQWIIQHSVWDRPETVKVLLNGQMDGEVISEQFFVAFLKLVRKTYLRAAVRIVSDFADSEYELDSALKVSTVNPPEYVYPTTIAETLWFYSRASVVLTSGSYGGVLARLTSTPTIFLPGVASGKILEFAMKVNSPGYTFLDLKLFSTVEERAQAAWDAVQTVLAYADEHNLEQDGIVPKLSDSALDNFPMSHKKGDVASLPTIIDDVELDKQKSFHTAADTAKYQISKKQVPMLKFDKSRNQYIVKPMT